MKQQKDSLILIDATAQKLESLSLKGQTATYSSILVTRSNPLNRVSFCVTEPWYSSIRS